METSYKKFLGGTELEVCEGKISEGQIAAEALDAAERIGPAELERNSGETSRGPCHSTGPPRKRTDVTQNGKTRQCLCVIVILMAVDLSSEPYVRRQTRTRLRTE
jgi:hypothetical protein